MPLLDHFHPPVSTGRHWEAFHGQWASAIAAALNLGGLPTGYLAEMQVTLGRIQVDVATFPPHTNGPPAPVSTSGGGVATLTAATYAPPIPALVLPALFPDEVEVLVYNTEGGLTLVAAVELVSPRNKDRPEARQAFASKCATYLHRGIGLVVVDIVSTRHANMHDVLMRLLGHPDTANFPGQATLYAVAYRPAQREGRDEIDVWPVPLTIGQPLPTLPLALRDAGCVPLALEASYTEARQRSLL